MKHYLAGLLLGLFLPGLLISGCMSADPARYNESGLNSHFNYPVDLPYESYIARSREMVEKTRVDLDTPNRGQIIDANSPFELLPDESLYPKTALGKYGGGVLLIHGLSDSPYHIKYIAQHLRDQGYLVRGLLLPGHGTVPGDLIKVTDEDWIRAATYGVNALKPLVEKLYIGGFSTGGALSVHHALVNDDVAGLLLFAPALKVHGAAWVTVYLRHFKTWLDTEDDLDFAKYESFTVNAGAQIYRLTQKIDHLIHDEKKTLGMPVFAALSMDDATVDSGFTVEFFQKYVTNDKSRLILYTNDPQEDLRNRPRLILTPSSFPKERVVDFAHTSITTPPADPHYGRNGEYHNCLHYPKDSAERKACLQNDNNLKGERSSDNKKNAADQKTFLQRLTYNPDYDRMIERLDAFLK